jgi:hypothetical protein
LDLLSQVVGYELVLGLVPELRLELVTVAECHDGLHTRYRLNA